MKKVLKRLAVIVVILVVVLAVVSFILGARATKDLNATIAKLKAEGAVLEVSDLKSARPDGTQFFEGPIDESPMAFLLSPSGAGPSSVAATGDCPWCGITKILGSLFNFTPEQEEDVRKAVSEQRELIEKVKAVARMKPTRWEDIVTLTRMDGPLINAKGPQLLACRNLVNLLLLDAYVAYRDGRPDDALDTGTLALQFAGHVRDSPTTIGQMIGVAVAAIVTTDLLPEITNDGAFSDEAIARYMAAADTAVSRAGLVQSFNGEALAVRQIHAGLRGEGPLNPSDPRGESLASSSDGVLGRVLVAVYGSPFFALIHAKDEQASLELMNELVKASELPCHAAKAHLDLVEQRLETYRSKWGYPVTVATVPSLGRNQLTFAEVEAQLKLSKIALALNRYRHAQGQWPADLHALVPAFLPELAEDPFSGNPMIYKLDGDSYVLYSVGLNQEDDGGNGKDRADLVWGYRPGSPQSKPENQGT
ncbi:MAG: hypothetical protein HY706_05565 [Candidatus Hydrogenedentes bacterium]|nr:hypothetical protein [Candidatus Hydrogenedentota bacterium]